MDMDTDNKSFSSWGIVIFLVLLFWFFTGNGFGRHDDRFHDAHCCNCVSNCEVEKQNIIQAAETNYRVERANSESTAAIIAGQHSLQERMDFYELQALRDRLAETQRQLIVAEDRNYNDGKFNAVNARLDALACRQLKAPEFMPYGGYVAATCGNYPASNGCCGCC